MRQHYKAVFVGDIYIQQYIQRTYSVTFVCTACQITCPRHPLCEMCSQWCGHPSSAATWKSEIRIQRGRRLARLSGSVFSPQWYGDANALWCLWKRRYCNCLPPGQGCPSAVRAPALSQSDWWMSRSGQSLKLWPALAKGLGPTTSLSISHIILLVPACLGQRFHPRKASWVG